MCEVGYGYHWCHDVTYKGPGMDIYWIKFYPQLLVDNLCKWLRDQPIYLFIDSYKPRHKITSVKPIRNIKIQI